MSEVIKAGKKEDEDVPNNSSTEQLKNAVVELIRRPVDKEIADRVADIKNINDNLVNNIINATYPIGIIIELSNDNNPNTLFPNTTWVEHGVGRVAVARNTAEAEFNATGKTGGAKTHILSIAEIPSHRHPMVLGKIGTSGSNGFYQGGYNTPDYANPYTGYEGGSQAHNNIQSYITVRRWTRTA